MADETVPSVSPTRPEDRLIRPAATAGSRTSSATTSVESSDAKNAYERISADSDDSDDDKCRGSGGVSGKEDGGGGSGCCSGLSDSLDCYWPRRYTVVILMFIGMCLFNGQRSNLGVVIVSALDSQANVYGGETPSAQEENKQLSALHWSSGMVGWLHSIHYIGAIISHVPCGYFLSKYQIPSNKAFGLCILLTLLVPLSMKVSYIFVCVVILSQGLVGGMLYPSCYDVMRHWTMPAERSRAGAIVLAGSYIAPTIGTLMSGALFAYAGWTIVFYYHGALGIVWYFLWVFFVYERPSKHPTISPDERKTIEERQGEAALIYEHHSVPLKAIFTSLPVYALIFCNFARSFIFCMLLTSGPAYINVFQFSHVENALFMSLPYAFMAIFSICAGVAADLMIQRHVTSTTNVRKIFTCSGFGMTAVLMFCLAVIADRYVAVVLLMFALGLFGLSVPGWQVNHLDLAPRYAGVLIAITMNAGTLAGVINPILVAAITANQSLSEWHLVFLVTGLLLTLSLTFYGFFGSGERQSWASPSLPPVMIVSRTDPMQGKPYGTFVAQVTNDKATVALPQTTMLSEPPPYLEWEAGDIDVLLNDSQLPLSEPTYDAAVSNKDDVPMGCGDEVAAAAELKHRRKASSASSS